MTDEYQPKADSLCLQGGLAACEAVEQGLREQLLEQVMHLLFPYLNPKGFYFIYLELHVKKEGHSNPEGFYFLSLELQIGFA